MGRGLHRERGLNGEGTTQREGTERRGDDMGEGITWGVDYTERGD